MRVLLVGDGGRESALAWKIAQSPTLSALAFSHPKPTWPEGEVLDARTVPAIAAAAARWGAELVVVGPEGPLADGLADALDAAGIPCFGPSAAAARLEASKAFAKQIMAEAGVPTAAAVVVERGQPGPARERAERGQVVVKVDGLAAGKGVFVCPTAAEAHAALDEVLGARFAAERVVLEDLLTGPEISAFALSDGERVVHLACARDHKRIGEGEQGENTGGMGAIAPAPGAPEPAELVARIHGPVVQAMAARGTPFRGLLFAGLMLTPDGPRVLEFNVRFGDPECQALLPLWEGDILPWLHGAAAGALPAGAPSLRPGAACCVVLASAGYPREAQRGVPLPSPSPSDQALVFHAAVARGPDGGLRTDGGRVLGITGLGPDLRAARAAAYAEVDRWRFPGCQVRADIGLAALEGR